MINGLRPAPKKIGNTFNISVRIHHPFALGTQATPHPKKAKIPHRRKASHKAKRRASSKKTKRRTKTR
jgi:BRCT domain type II-containing protein